MGALTRGRLTRRSSGLASLAAELHFVRLQKTQLMRIPRSRHLFRELEDRFLAANDDSGLDALSSGVKDRGHLTKREFVTVCRWKSPRTTPLVLRNGTRDIAQLTACALSTTNERLRVGALLLLQGVSWPTASVILHFFHSDPYPVLDYRAVWSVELAQPSPYSFEFWWQYVLICRALSRSLRLSMRTVDRALWQFSKEQG